MVRVQIQATTESNQENQRTQVSKFRQGASCGLRSEGASSELRLPFCSRADFSLPNRERSVVCDLRERSVVCCLLPSQLERTQHVGALPKSAPRNKDLAAFGSIFGPTYSNTAHGLPPNDALGIVLEPPVPLVLLMLE